MIPTAIKSKISSAMAYPVGAALVGKALAGVPQFAELRVYFLDCPLYPASKFTRALKRGDPYVIARAHFRRPDWTRNRAQPVATGLFDDRWSVTVYPVLRSRVAVAKRVLVEHGLAALKSWLATPRTDTWLMGKRWCEVVFDPSSGEIHVAEGSQAA
jgi:hypothetical protein